MGFPETIPLSFPKATKLPENVTVPIRHESTMLTPSPSGDVIPRDSSLKSSAAATNAEAAPPKPLNIPTSSGISVICTILAAVPPKIVPTVMPMSIVVQSTI